MREFIEQDLGPEGMSRSVVVAATSDKSPMERTKAAYVATAIAEYFRDQGEKVLFLIEFGHAVRTSSTRDRTCGRRAPDAARFPAIGLRHSAETVDVLE